MPWENGVAWRPPPTSLKLPVTQTPPSHPLHALLFHHKARVCLHCAVTDFLGGNLSCGCTVWPSRLETHPPQKHTHIKKRPCTLPPTPSSRPGAVLPLPFVVVKATWCSGLRPWLRLTLPLQAWRLQRCSQRQRKEQPFVKQQKDQSAM